MSKRKTTEEFIEYSMSIHGENFDYLQTEYINNKTDVGIRCKKHDILFCCLPLLHTKSKCGGCPECKKESYINTGTKNSLTTEEFIEKSTRKFKGKYGYSRVVYINNHTPVSIECKDHGFFDQLPRNHLSGKGCPLCHPYRKLTTEEYIKKAKEVQGDIYTYGKTIYTGALDDVIITCKIHGDFPQRASDHIHLKAGCPKCVKVSHLTNESFIEKARKMFVDRYGYSKVVIDGDYHSKVMIECKEHGYFEKEVSAHIYRGQGCPYCSVTSKIEILTDVLLKRMNFIFKRQKTFPDCKYIDLLYFDFYLIDYNICIEINGIQHYQPIERFGGEPNFILQQKRDAIKVKYCKDNHISLIIIKYDCIASKIMKRIEDILEKIILNDV